MTIYKIVARFGLDAELDSKIYCDLQKAYEDAVNWYNTNADSVTIYQEKSDFELGFFRTTKAYKVDKPF